MTYYNTRFDVMQMFADNTAGESTQQNRLITERLPNGNVSLTAYGWIQLAEYDESSEEVTVYYGHKNLGSKTVNKWLSEVRETAGDAGRKVHIEADAPQRGSPNDGVQYVRDGYIGDVSKSNKSPVERAATQRVVDSLKNLV